MNKFNQIYSGLSDTRNMIFRGMVFILLLMVLFSKNAIAVDNEFLKYCSAEVFDKKYQSADCWSCDIIKILINSMMKVTRILFKEIQSLSILILQLGGAIWLAVYLLKSLSSLAAQDPAKVMDGMLMFMFKWGFIYTIIFAGLDTIMEYIVNPLLSIGFDVGMSIANVAGFSLVLGEVL